jgi:hypothetical protein
MQLSAKGLIKPFGTNRSSNDNEEPDDVGAELPSDDEADDGDDEESDGEADDENGLDPFDELDEDEQEELVLNTEAVAEALGKVSLSSSPPCIHTEPDVSADPQVCFCRRQLVNHRTSCMEGGLP